MAAFVEVIRGPDKGWKYTAPGAGVRIGRGPGHAIALSDPRLPDGNIEIVPRPGGYLITNNLPTPVYLDERPLRPGESRTLHHGATLQPTPHTLLRLGIVASPPGADGVVSEPPPQPKHGWVRRNWPWVLLGAALVAHVAALRHERPVDAAAAGELKAAVWRLEERPGQTPAVKAELRFVRLTFTDAVYHDAARRPAEAVRCYREVRDALVRVARMRDLASGNAGEEETATLEQIAAFVSDRLKAQSAER